MCILHSIYKQCEDKLVCAEFKTGGIDTLTNHRLLKCINLQNDEILPLDIARRVRSVVPEKDGLN